MVFLKIRKPNIRLLSPKLGAKFGHAKPLSSHVKRFLFKLRQLRIVQEMARLLLREVIYNVISAEGYRPIFVTGGSDEKAFGGYKGHRLDGVSIGTFCEFEPGCHGCRGD